jgi:predicted permease
MRIEVDAPVMIFAIGIGLVTSLVFGLAPLLSALGLDLAAGLRHGTRGTARSHLRSALVGLEIALSVVLLIGAGLLVQTFAALQARDPGFVGDGVAAARVVLWIPGTRTESSAALNAIHARVLAALAGLPGVRSAAVTNYLPYSSATTQRIQADIFIRGQADAFNQTVTPITGADVSRDYFATMRIPLLRGRLFEATDTTDSAPVIVISERAAQRFWPGQDPIGREISWGQPKAGSNPWTRVVGVVGNVRHHAAEGEEGVEFYYPITQWPVATSHYVVRTDGDPAALLSTLRRTITDVEPSIAVTSTTTVEQTIGDSLWQRRLWSVLFSLFAALALGLAAIGVYGVVSYSVAQRQREMGLRQALGASPREVRMLVLRDGLLLTAAGAVGGLAAALLLGRLASNLLFGVTAYDGGTYGLVIVAITVTVLAACWLPARRASRVQPSVALTAD